MSSETCWVISLRKCDLFWSLFLLYYFNVNTIFFLLFLGKWWPLWYLICEWRYANLNAQKDLITTRLVHILSIQPNHPQSFWEQSVTTRRLLDQETTHIRTNNSFSGMLFYFTHRLISNGVERGLEWCVLKDPSVENKIKQRFITHIFSESRLSYLVFVILTTLFKI